MALGHLAREDAVTSFSPIPFRASSRLRTSASKKPTAPRRRRYFWETLWVIEVLPPLSAPTISVMSYFGPW